MNAWLFLLGITVSVLAGFGFVGMLAGIVQHVRGRRR